MSDGREERKEQEERRKWREQEQHGEQGDPRDYPWSERDWEDRGREPS